jgi:hypothetical protein
MRNILQPKRIYLVIFIFLIFFDVFTAHAKEIDHILLQNIGMTKYENNKPTINWMQIWNIECVRMVEMKCYLSIVDPSGHQLLSRTNTNETQDSISRINIRVNNLNKEKEIELTFRMVGLPSTLSTQTDCKFIFTQAEDNSSTRVLEYGRCSSGNNPVSHYGLITNEKNLNVTIRGIGSRNPHNKSHELK